MSIEPPKITLTPEQFTIFAAGFSEALLLISGTTGEILSGNRGASKLLGITSWSGKYLHDLVSNTKAQIASYLKMWSRSRVPLPVSLICQVNEGKLPKKTNCEACLLQTAKLDRPPYIILRFSDDAKNSQFIVLNKEIEKQKQALRQLQASQRALEQAKQALETQNEALIQEVKQRQLVEQKLKEAKMSAEAASYAKSSFLANMSHELRTPLNGILGYAQILARDNTLIPKQQEGINIIQRSGEYLLTLINDILDLSKIEAGKIELSLTDFHFAPFIQGITALFKMRAEQKAISFIYEPLSPLPVGIRADEKRMRQILINLLGNAIKFTSQGGVSLKVGVVKEGDRFKVENEKGEGTQKTEKVATSNLPLTLKKIRFQIEDSGTGIADSDLDKIFMPFQQVGELNYRAEGTGLGLAITKKLVNMMGGELQVESLLGHGSRFWLELDCPDVSEWVKSKEKIKQSVIIGFEGQSRKILVVDDKWENRSVLVNLLTPLGFEVLEANDGQACLSRAQESYPDLILIDLVMPVMDGFEATHKLRKISLFKKIPIIAVSASAFDLDQQKSWDAGCNEFMSKPICVEELLEKLKSHLGLRWIYEQASSFDIASEEVTENLTSPLVESSNRDDSTPLLGPVAEQAAILFDLAMRGDIAGILDEIDKLEESDKQLIGFCRLIRQLAKNFDEKEICNIVEHYIH